MITMSRRTAALFVVAGAAASLAGASPAAAQSWADVEAAAKKEGKLTLYHNIRPAGIEAILQTFRAAYPGIQTEQIRLGSGPLNERFRTEYAAGRNIADVVITFPDRKFMEEAKTWFAKWQPPEFKGNFPDGTSVGDQLFIIQQVRESIV